MFMKNASHKPNFRSTKTKPTSGIFNIIANSISAMRSYFFSTDEAIILPLSNGGGYTLLDITTDGGVSNRLDARPDLVALSPRNCMKTISIAIMLTTGNTDKGGMHVLKYTYADLVHHATACTINVPTFFLTPASLDKVVPYALRPLTQLAKIPVTINEAHQWCDLGKDKCQSTNHVEKCEREVARGCKLVNSEYPWWDAIKSTLTKAVITTATLQSASVFMNPVFKLLGLHTTILANTANEYTFIKILLPCAFVAIPSYFLNNSDSGTLSLGLSMHVKGASGTSMKHSIDNFVRMFYTPIANVGDDIFNKAISKLSLDIQSSIQTSGVTSFACTIVSKISQLKFGYKFLCYKISLSTIIANDFVRLDMPDVVSKLSESSMLMIGCQVVLSNTMISFPACTLISSVITESTYNSNKASVKNQEILAMENCLYAAAFTGGFFGFPLSGFALCMLEEIGMIPHLAFFSTRVDARSYGKGSIEIAKDFIDSNIEVQHGLIVGAKALACIAAISTEGPLLGLPICMLIGASLAE